MAENGAPGVRPRLTSADFVFAAGIVDSPEVIGQFAACEFDELDDDGKTWIAAIVRATRQSIGNYLNCGVPYGERRVTSLIPMVVSPTGNLTSLHMDADGSPGQRVTADDCTHWGVSEFTVFLAPRHSGEPPG